MSFSNAEILQRFLSVADAHRALRILKKLGQHGHTWALTGGLATEIHCLCRGCQPSLRALSDIDFIAESFEAAPQTLGDDFLFHHIHPNDPSNKMMLQLVDAECKLRIDVFRSYADPMGRTSELDISGCVVKLISLEDLTARVARQTLDLAEGIPTPSKHAKDFLRLVELIDPIAVETAWPDHRKPDDPCTFKEAADRLRYLIQARHDLLITTEYSKDPKEICLRCQSTCTFQLADPKIIFSILGHS